MLPKKYRITFVEFQNNPNKTARVFGNFFDIYSKTNNSTCCRFVFIVPKYIDKRSSHRHRIKRLMVEVVRAKVNFYNSHADYMIKVKKPVNKVSEKLMTGDLIRLLDLEHKI
jgi:ribonuclease P protein component